MALFASYSPVSSVSSRMDSSVSSKDWNSLSRSGSIESSSSSTAISHMVSMSSHAPESLA